MSMYASATRNCDCKLYHSGCNTSTGTALS